MINFYKRMENSKEQGSRDRIEYNNMIRENTKREIRSELQWKQRYININNKMQENSKNFLQHINRHQSQSRQALDNLSTYSTLEKQILNYSLEKPNVFRTSVLKEQRKPESMQRSPSFERIMTEDMRADQLSDHLQSLQNQPYVHYEMHAPRRHVRSNILITSNQSPPPTHHNQSLPKLEHPTYNPLPRMAPISNQIPKILSMKRLPRRNETLTNSP